MKMTGGVLKGASAIFIGWLTYLNDTFSPLFWVLLALVALDLFLNAHKEGKQLEKIGSMAISLGVPSYIAANFGNPNLGKYLVAIMCLVYLQIVVPALIQKIASLKLSSDPKQNSADQAALIALAEKVAAMEKTQAEQVLSKEAALMPTPTQAAAPTVINDGGQGVK